MKGNVLSTIMLSAALAMGIGGERTRIKKAVPIHKSWKDKQSKSEAKARVRKAMEKRERKALIKKTQKEKTCK